jgi:hypothetical protein
MYFPYFIIATAVAAVIAWIVFRGIRRGTMASYRGFQCAEAITPGRSG